MSHNKSISKVHGNLYKQRELECASRSEEVMEEIELLEYWLDTSTRTTTAYFVILNQQPQPFSRWALFRTHSWKIVSGQIIFKYTYSSGSGRRTPIYIHSFSC